MDSPSLHQQSEPTKYTSKDLKSEEVIFNLGPQHPSMHGVLRLEVITDGEIVKETVPHIGYLHRCFEKHAENLNYAQIIPYVDRMDYVASMSSEHIYALGVEKMLGITDKIPKRVEYIRVLVSELNRLASHFIGIGTYAVDLGATTPFLWMMKEREYILRLLEWVSGARLLYNYIWIGGLYYDVPLGFEKKCSEFINHLKPKLKDLENLLINNQIFVSRTADIGVLPLEVAINYGVTGPMLRASGLRWDLRKVDKYSVYEELDFETPIGEGKMGKKGDCWDRNYVRFCECLESVKIIEQVLDKLQTDHPRTREFDPQVLVPRRIKPPKTDFYFRGESPKGELGFFFRQNPKHKKGDIPFRLKVRSPSFCNLSVLPFLAKDTLLSDLIAIVGSLDINLGEVDR